MGASLHSGDVLLGWGLRSADSVSAGCYACRVVLGQVARQGQVACQGLVCLRGEKGKRKKG